LDLLAIQTTSIYVLCLHYLIYNYLKSNSRKKIKMNIDIAKNIFIIFTETENAMFQGKKIS